jgi:hypothetical protein
MPPNKGMAMGTMMSDPHPVDVKIGRRAITVVAVVIMQGSARMIHREYLIYWEYKTMLSTYTYTAHPSA